MTNQERNRDALIEHIAEQDRIIRRRNDQIGGLVKRIEQDAVELSKYRAMHSEQIKTIARLQENPHPLTADDITDEMVERAARQYVEEEYTSWERSPALAKNNARESVRGILEAALTEPPARPEGAEKVEAVLHQYWSGDIDGDDLADRIAEEMNR